MKRQIASLLFVAGILAPSIARAEPQLGLGVVRSAQSMQFQADLDVFRHFGFQAATGDSVRESSLSGSAGGRFYLFGGRISPYAGLLYNSQTARTTDAWGHTTRTLSTQLAGPTLGFRVKAERGIGAFVELQYLGDPKDSNKRASPSVGAGIQWWF